MSVNVEEFVKNAIKTSFAELYRQEGLQEGRQEGRQEGLQEGWERLKKAATAMLKANHSWPEICGLLGLSEDELHAIDEERKR
jgi:predicted transposase YdaD